MRVLVIEDDQEAAAYMAKGLKEQGYVVDHAATGPDGLALATAETYDLLIVDRMLPGMDGLVVVEALRKSDNQTPVLFLSALGQVDDRVKGLQAGGDDYLTKPYAFSELLARIEALLRRGKGVSEQAVFKVADLEIDLLKRSVTRVARTLIYSRVNSNCSNI